MNPWGLNADDERALHRLFEQGPADTEEVFTRLAAKCGAEELLHLVLLVVYAYVTPPGRVRLIPATQEQLKDLANNLDGLAGELEPIADSIGAAAFEALRSFPEIARAAAKDLRAARESRKRKSGPSRWTMVNHQEAVLLDHVRDATGSHHENEVLTLLQAAFYAFAPHAMKSKRYGDDPQVLLKRRGRQRRSPIRLAWAPQLHGELLRQTNS